MQYKCVQELFPAFGQLIDELAYNHYQINHYYAFL